MNSRGDQMLQLVPQGVDGDEFVRPATDELRGLRAQVRSDDARRWLGQTLEPDFVDVNPTVVGDCLSNS
jgi:hypothetical protein